MKKIITLLLVLCLTAGLCSCGKAPSEGDDTPAPEIHGTVTDFGRFSALVPDGWTKADLGDMGSDFTCVLVHGKAEDFMLAPQVSIIYSLPSEVIFSSRGFYDDTVSLEEFDAVGFHWEPWSGSFEGITNVCAEGTGEAGYLTVSLQDFSEEPAPMSFDDPVVQAIINSITVEPAIESDWVTVETGAVTAVLPAVEGYAWDGGEQMSTSDVEAEVELDLEEGKMVIIPKSGTGAFYQVLDLYNEDGTFTMGTLKVAIGIKDGKAVALYEAVKDIFDEPKEKEHYDWEDTTDYEAMDQFYRGAWSDDNNGLTMFIQRTDPAEYIYLVTIQSSDRQLAGAAVIEVGGTLAYYQMTVDGESVDTGGWFMIDGDMLIWGHDDGVGEFENATIFTRLG